MTKVELEKIDETPPASQQELRTYIRKNLVQALIALVLLSAGLVVVGKLFEAEMIAVTESVYHSIGTVGLLAVLFASDAVFTPVPPDVVLIVIANCELRSQWPWLLPVIGLLSAAAGNLGWWFGYRFARFPWATKWIAGLRAKYADQILRYDRWAIALGAITPLPFSFMCITSGALGMSWHRMAPVTLLRLPRFALAYVVIASSVSG